MDVLEKLYQKHETWLDIVQSFRVNKDTAKDIVSEMYINVHNHVQNGNSIIYENDEINYYFIFVTLRNLVYDLKRKEKKVQFEQITYLQSEVEDPKDKKYEYLDEYEKLKTITQWLEHPDFLELLKDETKIQDFNKEKMQVYYLRRIFKEVFIDGKKICLLYTSPSPRDGLLSRMPSSA